MHISVYLGRHARNHLTKEKAEGKQSTLAHICPWPHTRKHMAHQEIQDGIGGTDRARNLQISQPSSSLLPLHVRRRAFGSQNSAIAHAFCACVCEYLLVNFCRRDTLWVLVDAWVCYTDNFVPQGAFPFCVPFCDVIAKFLFQADLVVHAWLS